MGKPRKYHQDLDWTPTPIRWPPLVPSSVYEYAQLECMGVVEGANPLKRGRDHFRSWLFECQDGACFWCWRPMSWDRIRTTETGKRKSNPAFATFEHLRRKRDGGRFSRANIVLAHEACNRSRDRACYAHDPHPPPPRHRHRRIRAMKHLRPVFAEHNEFMTLKGVELLRFLVLAMNGEAGEAANLVKKEWRGDLMDGAAYLTKLVDEIADTANYAFMAAEALGVDLELVMDRKLHEFEARPAFKAWREQRTLARWSSQTTGVSVSADNSLYGYADPTTDPLGR